jgi:hypothetical protein
MNRSGIQVIKHPTEPGTIARCNECNGKEGEEELIVE